ncbi:MAG TPA: hypothetical protein VHB25_20230 [Gemmatimonadaceae bacterium]|nr:hypothetical protein [Gemmatimonadaceae bacterium]
MNRTTRFSVSLAVLASVGGAARLSAQQFVGYGAAEAGGLGSSLYLLGVSASGAGLGWHPVASVEAYRLNFRSGPGTTTSNNVFSPSIGMKYQTATAATQGRIGYSWVSSSVDIPTTVSAFPIPAESKNGVFVVAQHDYWGTGEHTGQLIGSYNFANEFLWARGRAAKRMGAPTSPVMLGGELGFLGGGNTAGVSKTWGFFVGPMISLNTTKALKFDLSGGYRANTSTPNNASGYAELDFVYVFPTR